MANEDPQGKALGGLKSKSKIEVLLKSEGGKRKKATKENCPVCKNLFDYIVYCSEHL